MRAVLAQQFGDPDVLRIGTVDTPHPGAGKVLVRVYAAGVNFTDSERRRALYRIPALPWIPGIEGSGVIEAIGADVDSSWLGARVAFWSFEASGTYAEFAVAPADSLFRLPDAIPLDVAAGLPVQGLTGFGLTHFATALAPGQSALVHAAASGAGLLLVQLLRLRGVQAFGTASSPSEHDLIREMGGIPVGYDSDLAADIRAVRGVPMVDVVFDSIGYATQKQGLSLLSPYGQLVLYPDASGPPRPIDPADHYVRPSLRVTTVGLGAHPPHSLSHAREELMRLVVEGRLRVHVGHTYPLSETSHAHRLLEGRRSQGKILLYI